MWIIIKFNKKKLSSLKDDFKKKVGNNCVFYQPKIKIQRYSKNKLRELELPLLGNYIFCYHENFNNYNILSNLKFCKGLDYILNGSKQSQSEIVSFISRCKSLTDSKGFISKSLFDLKINTNYRFNTGPFVEKIFKIIDLQKNKINILMGNIKTKVNYKDFLFSPV